MYLCMTGRGVGHGGAPSGQFLPEDPVEETSSNDANLSGYSNEGDENEDQEEQDEAEYLWSAGEDEDKPAELMEDTEDE